MTEDIRTRIRNTAERLVKIIDLGAPDDVVKNEIALLVQLSENKEDPSKN